MLSVRPPRIPPTAVLESQRLREFLTIWRGRFGGTMRGPLLLVAGLYLLSAFVHAPAEPWATEGTLHLSIGPLVLAPPRVLSGDPPHYLAAVHSLVEDGDFDLANNYRKAEGGGWDLGARFRGRSIDHHTDRDESGREIGTHSPFFTLLLASFSWPFRGTSWVEPVCILATLCVSLLGLGIAAAPPFVTDPSRRIQVLLLLALATPLWCYSRDLWAEPWIMAIWVGLLVSENLALLFALGVMGVLIKYPFAAVPAAMGLVALLQKRYTRAWMLLGSSLAGLVLVVAVVQYLFRDADHFSWFHSGVHAGFGWPWKGIPGLLFGPENGLFCFFPFLLWSLGQFRKGGRRYLPAVAFFLLHAGYLDWMGGTGFSARYLVPVLPIMVWAVIETSTKGWIFRLAVAYSLVWGFVGGFFPALVYDRSPWEVIHHILRKTSFL